MQIVETSNEGLKRAYAVTIPAADIAARVEGEIKKIAPQVRMPGFRPGKVPANLVKKMHGPALHQEALQTTIREAMDKLVADHQLRPAMQPDVSLGEGYEEGQDAKLTVSLEVLPKVEAPALDGLKLDKLVVPVTEDQVDEAVNRIAAGQKKFSDAAEGAEAKDGDQLIIDFLGKLDGEPFEGGAAEDQALEIGAGRFIPGFEEQLVGAKAGDEKVITVTFPEDYPAANLAGKETTFDITVKAVKNPGEFVADDDFAKALGLESLEQLRGLLKGQLEQETAGLTRTQMKRALLDQLAAGHDFDVPPSMVEAEFEQIWQQLTQEAQNEENPEEALKEIEAEKDDYRKIAERRVRLGLLLSEIGQANGVVVTAQEMEMLIRQAAQQYREQDRQRFIDYVRSEPLAAAQLRAPLYEDKVVDFLFDKAEVSEREVTREELQAAIEAEEGAAAAPAEAKPAKKKAAKKAEAETEAAGEAEEAKPAKKAPAKKKAAADAEAEPAAEGEAKPAKKKAAKKATAEGEDA
ncbi:trigger factor [Novosphingobium capsulatum]|uniref:Trigger factor n=1 Tax=Novosphingobium capsulatum TaxID=13688 RepID=A0ABU1MQG2_9SPHN|nr:MULTISPECIES: trigger factor [Novosphingobium]KPF52724.1 trigger factor [Novosphingobium sp. AAP1]MBB3356288.1 trigger factor [Novosphingobium sp. BK256]MBB3372689.1 trigger factor [Novosphingobium sp. BK280]MBB3377056.1 trigger factor [Novosphingobium sp. BK258]MBB3419532.1 trigger factor [Novosphingobium sp. BK267]